SKGKIIKTMMMAYGKKSRESQILKKQIYDRYSHLGNRNFISYAQNASKKGYRNSKGDIKVGLDSPSIRRQLSAHFAILEKEISKKSSQFAISKKVNLKK